MTEPSKPAGNRSKQAIILGVLGAIIFLAGVAVATVKGTGLRGSGLGTVLIIVGVVLVALAYLRFRNNPQK